MEPPDRKYIRRSGYDYRTYGYYFITIVTHLRQQLLGEICDGNNTLSDIGLMVDGCISELHDAFDDIAIDDYVIMPNHIHLIISNLDNTYVIEVIRRLKAKTSYLYHRMLKRRGVIYHVPQQNSNQRGVINHADSRSVINHAPTYPPLWQRNYYDRIIRNQREYDFVRNYIYLNPQRWDKDKLNKDCGSECDNISQALKDIQEHRLVNPSNYFTS